jgi:EXPERA (EXPanded EBP superfamily)
MCTVAATVISSCCKTYQSLKLKVIIINFSGEVTAQHFWDLFVTMNQLYRTVLIVYFVTHIPTSLLIDLQALFSDLYPEFLRAFMREQYISKFGDYLMADPPIWLKALIGFEVLQIPFFFIATYALVYKKNWIRIPSIIYSSHVVTAVSVILTDFYNSTRLSFNQKAVLFSFYLPYLIIPLSLLLYMSFVPKPFQSSVDTKKRA